MGLELSYSDFPAKGGKNLFLSLSEKRDSGKTVSVSTILLAGHYGFFTFWVTNKFPFKWLECRGGERKGTPHILLV